MTTRPLRSLLKVRRTSLTQAKAALAGALEAERAASDAEATATRLIRQEIAAACEATADDRSVEALAAWLPQARASLAAVAERHRLALASTARARAELAAARAAEAVVEKIIEARQAKEQAIIQKLADSDINERISDRHCANDVLIPPPSPART